MNIDNIKSQIAQLIYNLTETYKELSNTGIVLRKSKNTKPPFPSILKS